MGKTTILSCLYSVLSGRLDKLDNILFETIAIKFEGNEELKLKSNDLNRYLEEIKAQRKNERKSGKRDLELTDFKVAKYFDKISIDSVIVKTAMDKKFLEEHFTDLSFVEQKLINMLKNLSR